MYADIVEFATLARADVDETSERRLIALRLASRDIAQAVKVAGQMINNIERYSSAANPDIRHEYHSIRIYLARLLRRLYRIKATDDPQLRASGFKELRETMEKSDVLSNGTLDRLIRGELITSVMATSLMNDSAHQYDLTRLLIEAGEYLFVARGEPLENLPPHILEERRPSSSFTAIASEARSSAFPGLLQASLTGEYRRMTNPDPDLEPPPVLPLAEHERRDRDRDESSEAP